MIFRQYRKRSIQFLRVDGRLLGVSATRKGVKTFIPQDAYTHLTGAECIEIGLKLIEESEAGKNVK